MIVTLTLQLRQNSFTVKCIPPSCTPPLIKTKQELPTPHSPSWLFLAGHKCSFYHHERKERLAHFAPWKLSRRGFYFHRNTKAAPQQGSDMDSSICSLHLSALIPSLLCSQILMLEVFDQQYISRPRTDISVPYIVTSSAVTPYVA